MRFESWVNFQNASLLTFSIYAKNSCLWPASNQGLPAFQRASLPPAPSMFNPKIYHLFDCVWIYNWFRILDLFPNRTSDICKIQSSRLNRILWSHGWWKVVPSQNCVNTTIRNSINLQLYQVSQILLASSSSVICVSCLKVCCSNPGGSVVYFPICTLILHEFVKFFENLKTSKNLEVFELYDYTKKLIIRTFFFLVKINFIPKLLLICGLLAWTSFG